MSPNTNEVPKSQAEQVLTDVLMSFFGQVVSQAVKEIAPTLNLPLVDESQKLAQKVDRDNATAELNQINEAIATQRGVLEAIRQTLLSENVSSEHIPTTTNTYADVANMGFARRAALLLSTTQASDINFVADSTSHSIGKQPQIYRALCLRLQREIAQGNLDRAMSSLKDESTPVTEKATIIRTIEQLKSALVEIDEKIDAMSVKLG